MFYDFVSATDWVVSYNRTLNNGMFMTKQDSTDWVVD